MSSDEKAWPSEVFRPVFQYVRSKYPKLTLRRTAKITKAILAAQEALAYAKSRNRQEEMSDVPLESGSVDELRQRTPWLF